MELEPFAGAASLALRYQTSWWLGSHRDGPPWRNLDRSKCRQHWCQETVVMRTLHLRRRIRLDGLNAVCQTNCLSTMTCLGSVHRDRGRRPTRFFPLSTNRTSDLNGDRSRVHSSGMGHPSHQSPHALPVLFLPDDSISNVKAETQTVLLQTKAVVPWRDAMKNSISDGGMVPQIRLKSRRRLWIGYVNA